MKKLFKSKWLYVFLFVAGVLLTANVVMTSMIKKNINKQRNISSAQNAPVTKQVYQREETNETSNKILLEENDVKESTGVEEEKATEVPQKADEGFVMPLHGKIINRYTGSELVYSTTLRDYRVHNGIDIKAAMLSQVKACASGVVESVSRDSLMGIIVVINHPNGFKSVYSNLSSEDMVKAGEEVGQGDIINGVGDTALIETGEEAHLHFELIKDGMQVDPQEYFR